MISRTIKTDKEYKQALLEIERLLVLDPEPGTPEADRLDISSILVEEYEKKNFPFEKPDPVEAIRFRMEQKGLSQRDLIPFIGSRSKVSEVLSGKRSLTLKMVRALHEGLGIPADVLLQESTENSEIDIHWNRFPLLEIVKRNWISGSKKDIKERPDLLMKEFFSPLELSTSVTPLLRRTYHQRAASKMDHYSLLAWTARVLIKAKEMNLSGKYEKNTVDGEFMYKISRLSWSEQGPLLAKEFLSKYGIAMVVEPHLPRTHLDGASMLDDQGVPVIGMTIRFDRIDNFWYTLLHELAHISKHLEDSGDFFFDDLEYKHGNDPKEKEADRIAGETLISRRVWPRSSAFKERTPEAIGEFAKKEKIHPAIVAGRIRHIEKNYKKLNQLVGHGQVRKLFKDVQWPVGG